MSGFRKFLLQGNLVQLAVAVVIGTVFAQLITAFTEGFITPLLGVFGSVPEFGDASFTVNGSEFVWGPFVDSAFTFVLTAAVLYFAVVLPTTKLMDRFARKEEATHRPCPACVSEIDKAATRCAYCTTEVTPETAPVP